MIPDIPHQSFVAAFGADPMRLPDVVARGSSRADWPRVADALEHLGWASGGIRDFAIPNPEGRTVTLEPIEGLRFNFFDDDEIVFDFDLSELSTQAAVDIVCVLAGAIGRATRQSVAFIPEGGLDAVVTYDPIGDSFVIHAQNPS